MGDAFNWGWAKFQQNVGVILIAMLIYLAIIFVVEGILFALAILPALSGPGCTYDSNGLVQSCTLGGPGFFLTFLLYGVGIFVYVLLFAFLQAGVIRGAIAIANGQKLELPIFFNFDKVGNVIVGALIVGAATFVGFLLCGVGALVVALFTPFWLFFVIDKNESGWDAIMSSVRLVNKNLGSVVVLIIGVFIAYFIGALLCGIGLLVAAPVALLALTYGYRKLQGEEIAA